MAGWRVFVMGFSVLLVLCCQGTSLAADCNGNAIPDTTDISGGTSFDCNTNGIPDECDLVQIVQEEKVTSDAPSGFGFFGRSVAIQGDIAAVGATGDDEACGGSVMCNAGAVHVYERDGASWSQQAKILASDGASNDSFGTSISLSGDTLIVGSAGDDDMGGQSGSAYVYTRSGGVWTEQAKLTADDGAANDYFGASVSIDGDTAVVGAYFDDDDGDASGSAYVFTRTGGIWTQQGKLTADDAAGGDEFGLTVSVYGDTAVVGAHRDDDAGPESGSAYVFTRTGGVWTQQQKLTSDDASAGDEFGLSVSIRENTIAVGAHHDDVACAACNSGSAYVFVNTGGVWSQEDKLIPPDAAADDEFGYTIAVNGDTVIVGARLDDDPSADSGSAYVFARSGGAWTLYEKISGNDTGGTDTFGQSVALDGDRAIVGAVGDNVGFPISGSAYIFDLAAKDCNGNSIPDECEADCNGNGVADDCEIAAGSGFDCDLNGVLDSCDIALGSATDCNLNDIPDVCDIETLASYDCNGDDIPDECELAGGSSSDCNMNDIPDSCDVEPAFDLDKLLASDGDMSDILGADVAIDGDTVVVGASLDDDGGVLSKGSAYVYVRTGSGWLEQAKLTASDGATGDYFGTSVAIDGETIVVGAYDDDDTIVNSGSAYVFVRDGDIWSEQAKLNASDPAFQSYLGFDVAVDGDTALVGARGSSMGANPNGAAYVFVRSGTVWTQQQKLFATDGGSEDQFGVTVSLSGDTAIVGAPMDDDFGANTGSAYVFTRTAGVWTQEAKIFGSQTDNGDRFGAAVAVDGDTAVVGAYNDETYPGGGIVVNNGAAYVFYREGGVWAEQDRLTTETLNYGDLFGQSVAVDGDTVIVGARNDDHACPGDIGCNSGAAYVFVRTANDWIMRSKLGVGLSSANDQFGFSVSISGDTAAISANLDDEVAENAGAAYVFDLQNSADCNENGVPDECDLETGFSDDCNTNAIPDECEIDCNANGVPDDCDLANLTSDDCNADGIPDECGFIPGTYIDCNSNGQPDECDISSGGSPDCNTNGIPDECDLNGWINQQAKLTALDQIQSVSFGESVSISGDTAVIGTGNERNGPYNNVGAIYIFERIDGIWTQIVRIVNPDPANDDAFGQTVGISGDTIIASCHGDDNEGPSSSSGSVYIFVRSGGVWMQQAFLTADDAGGGDQFGFAVAIDGDTALVGSVTDDVPEVNAGSAYVFVRSGGVWTQQAKLIADDAGAQEYFGQAVALDGDTAVIGAPEGNTSPGKAYVFVRSGGVWTQEQKLLSDDAADYDQFGISVAVQGDTAVVGAPYDDDDGAFSGSAYVFVRSGGAWAQQQKLTASNAMIQDLFGLSVAVHGDTAFIASPRSDVVCPACDAGAVFKFDRFGATWTEDQIITAADASTNALVGISVSVDDNNSMIVGSYSDNSFKPGGGAAYVFDFPSADCNLNAIADECDIATLFSPDCDTNGVPDECDPDCDSNSIPDACDITMGSGADCDDDGVLNDCEVYEFSLSDYAAFMICYTDPTPPCLAQFDIAEPCGVIDLADYDLFASMLSGP
ncbi:MAG TPA: FG-GAP repeat protein [Phycisphaerae bacterium]|nr:FG-GAP repeat protein [Phycisphaerae bacterium]